MPPRTPKLRTVADPRTMLRVRAGWIVVLLPLACRHEASTTTEPSTSTDSPATARADDPAPEHPMVDLDLSPSGIAATIRGPEGAKASAKDGYVEVEAAPDFHMEVHRGPLDVLEEKADIVRRWGPSFRRFVQDDNKTVVYETEVAGDNKFHFVSHGDVDGLKYHCRSAKDGADSIEAIQRMIVGCHAITAHKKVTAKNTP